MNQRKRFHFWYSLQLMYKKCYKANFKRGASYIDLLDWAKNKKETINQKNEDDRCFQYAATVAFNYEEIVPHPQNC